MNKLVVATFLLLIFFCAIAAVNAQRAVSAKQSDSAIPFDHGNTGFDLSGSHQFVTCEGCHQGGRFVGTPTECALCHSDNSLTTATGKSLNHINTSAECDSCHAVASWVDIVRVDHTQVFGNCESCHNNLSAEGKPINHPATTSPCNVCHSDVSWLPALFDHANVSSGCFNCHNGIDATGKNASHVLTNNSCELCHSTFAWEPAPLNHSAVLGSCMSCHNGMTATGKDPGHLLTSAECSNCHSTNAWLPATFDHATITDNCNSCHNGTDATGMDLGHFQTNIQCNQCHTTTSWLPDTFRHTSPNYPGDHRARLSCTDCHGNNSESITWSNAAYMPNCAGCHDRDYRSGSHKKVDSPQINYTVSELRDCAGACHEYTDTTFTTIRRTRTGEHSVRDNEF